MKSQRALRMILHLYGGCHTNIGSVVNFFLAVNHRVGNITFKYGVEILITVDEALAVYNNFGKELCKKKFKRKYLMLVLLFKL